MNGGDNIAVKDCTVGPSNTNVPYRAQWSNAIFMKRYIDLFIPYSFQKYGTEDLMQTEITFADRQESPKTIQQIFDDLNVVVTRNIIVKI